MNIHEYMSHCQSQRFTWGTFDCCIYAAGAIEVATGRNPMAACPAYNNDVTASIVLRETFGSTSVRDIFMQLVSEYGAVQIQPHEMKNGDLACVEWPHEFTRSCDIDQSCGMGVVYNNQVLVCCTHGLVSVPTTHRVIDLWRFS